MCLSSAFSNFFKNIFCERMILCQSIIIIIIIHIGCKLDCQKQIKEKTARQRKSCRTASGYSVSVCSGLSLQSSSSVTPRASASLIALDTRQSPFLRMFSTVRFGNSAKSANCWTVNPFCARICFRFISFLSGKSKASTLQFQIKWVSNRIL